MALPKRPLPPNAVVLRMKFLTDEFGGHMKTIAITILEKDIWNQKTQNFLFGLHVWHWISVGYTLGTTGMDMI
jgi:hypothetical protein